MPVKKITIQDIADACGLSRNTVSKVFNNRGAVPEATRRMVFAKARELGYGQFPQAEPASGEQSRNIALLARHKLWGHNFGAYFITSFTDSVSRAGFTIRAFEISDEEVQEKKLPPHLDLERTAGILCIEIFDKAYQSMICSLGLPCTFVDGYAGSHRDVLSCDFISMENYAMAIALTKKLLSAGARQIGFVGDKDHCDSFLERWYGYQSALADANLRPDRRCCILDQDNDSYGETEWLLRRLSAMPAIPDAFVCANDYLAIHLMAALKRMGIRIPEDTMLTGFDGTSEASLVEPSLTTALIPSTDIGRLASDLLIDRIQNPGRPFRRIAVKTTLVLGGSTR